MKRSESELEQGNLNKGAENSSLENGSRLLLKLNYEEIMKPTNHTCSSVQISNPSPLKLDNEIPNIVLL